jgi:hypothetical protein
MRLEVLLKAQQLVQVMQTRPQLLLRRMVAALPERLQMFRAHIKVAAKPIGFCHQNLS